MSPSEQLELKLPFIPWIFDNGPWMAILGCVLVSHIWMMLMTNFGEDRRVSEVFKPRNQYYGYLFGDLALAGAAGCFIQTLSNLEVDTSSFVLTLGEVLAIGIAFLVAWFFRVGERMGAGQPAIFVDQAAKMPTKVHHDLVVMPFFIYTLAISIMASLAFAPWDNEAISYRILGVTGLVLWAICLFADSLPEKRSPHPYEYTSKNTLHHRLAKNRIEKPTDD